METFILDEAPKHIYFAEIPNLIDDLPLPGPAHRLYCHYKRRTGEDPKGACWESSETTAKLLQMSKATVIRARKDLVKFKLIRVEKVNRGHGEFPYCKVFIVNIWAINIEIYSWNAEEREKYFKEARQFVVEAGIKVNRKKDGKR